MWNFNILLCKATNRAICLFLVYTVYILTVFNVHNVVNDYIRTSPVEDTTSKANWENTGLTWSVTGKEEEGHSWLKPPFTVLLGPTKNRAVPTSHSPMQLLDQIPTHNSTHTKLTVTHTLYSHMPGCTCDKNLVQTH